MATGQMTPLQLMAACTVIGCRNKDAMYKSACTWQLVHVLVSELVISTTLHPTVDKLYPTIIMYKWNTSHIPKHKMVSCVCACVCVCVSGCVRTCGCGCVCVCVKRYMLHISKDSQQYHNQYESEEHKLADGGIGPRNREEEEETEDRVKVIQPVLAKVLFWWHHPRPCIHGKVLSNIILRLHIFRHLFTHRGCSVAMTTSSLFSWPVRRGSQWQSK